MICLTYQLVRCKYKLCLKMKLFDLKNKTLYDYRNQRKQ